MPAKRPRLVSAILTAGLIAGTLDIISACTFFYSRTGKNPVLVLNYVASSLFGKDAAYSGGAPMAAAGLLIHYLIAFGWTILFFVLYPTVSVMRGNRIAVGLSYGIFVWTLMNVVLVPMTRVQAAPFHPVNAVINAIILMYAIGLPISIVANRYYSASRHS